MKLPTSRIKMKNRFPIIKIIFVIIITLVMFFGRNKTSMLFAQSRIESNNYRIQFPNFNSGAGIPSSSGYKLDSTIGQGAAGLFSSSGYRVKSGFQYIHSIIPFSFSVSDIQINFGSLTPNSFSTDSSTLTVSAGGAGGYSVTAAEKTPLKSSNNLNTIADTTCNGGGCTEVTAAVWNSTSAYGFGYNMTGNDVPAGFVDSTYFKQFADLSNSETPQIVMSSVNVGTSRVATIAYKINVSAVQPAGSYQNVILFTAIPSY